MLAVATALVTSAFSGWHLAVQVGALAVFFLVVQKGLGPALVWIWRRSRDPADSQLMSSGFLAVLLIALMLCCLATNTLGVFSIFGAFALGVSLHGEVELVAAWRRMFSRFVLVALVPVFFTNTGLRTEIGALQTPVAWIGCGVVLFAAVAGKLGGCWLGGKLTGLTGRDSACVAALMNTRALMGLVAINIGADLGLLPKSLFTMFVIMALLTTVMTAPLLKWWLPKP
jgi:Kef-type K+ transport system membrane component KefB